MRAFVKLPFSDELIRQLDLKHYQYYYVDGRQIAVYLPRVECMPGQYRAFDLGSLYRSISGVMFECAESLEVALTGGYIGRVICNVDGKPLMPSAEGSMSIRGVEARAFFQFYAQTAYLPNQGWTGEEEVVAIRVKFHKGEIPIVNISKYRFYHDSTFAWVVRTMLYCGDGLCLPGFVSCYQDAIEAANDIVSDRSRTHPRFVIG